MIDSFVSKLKSNLYISNDIYEFVLDNDPSVIPQGFNLDEYNNKILDILYKENKEYFDNMFKGVDDNIHLDKEQCKAILADEKYSLVIAGAGTGKTTTIVAKVKYLVDKLHVDPNRILVMSYTRKATEEIAKRIEDGFNLPVYVTTFHSLGYDYIRQIFNDRKCTIMDRNKRDEIKLNFFRDLYKDKSKIREIIYSFEDIKYYNNNNFVVSRFFIDNYTKFDTYDDFVDYYVEKRIEEAKLVGFRKSINDWVDRELKLDYGSRSMRGEYMKSAGEFIIANFLYTHGLDYSYEEIYEELLENNSIYRPDFTVDYGGKKIYIEYFGLDDEGYNRIRKLKREYHNKNGNLYIEIDRLSFDKIEEELDQKLKKFHVKYHERSEEIIYEQILRLNPLSQVFPFMNFLHKCVDCRKESLYREDFNLPVEFLNTCKELEIDQLRIQYKYILEYDKYYSKECFGGNVYYFDFADLLYYSVKYLEQLTNSEKLQFDYVIIDEYQDISQIKYELSYKTAQRNNAKVYAVGDDWQTIYSFSGSRIEYIYRFKEFFKGAKSFNISKTYRNSQELINTSGEFIMQNPDQLKKQLISTKHDKNPIIFKEFDGDYDNINEITCLKETIREIYKEHPEHSILILARTNSSIHRILRDDAFIDGIGTKIGFEECKNIDIDAMTMHKSKGLTYDEVIIIGLNSRFPSDGFEDNWYINLYKNKPIQERIIYAEERRLFYVALTRTKNKAYLLTDIRRPYRSPFLDELYLIHNGKLME